MPNVDFDRSMLNKRMPQTLNSPDFKHRLLSVKAYLDYEDEQTVRVNFLDTLRPELWCVDGLARHLEPDPGRSYGMHLVENLPRIPTQFEFLPAESQAWVLYVQVNPDQIPFDDAYFLKKVRDQIGFGSLHNINVTLLPGRQHTISIETPLDEEDESEAPNERRSRFIAPTADLSASDPNSDSSTLFSPSDQNPGSQTIVSPLILERGLNTVIITTIDQRIGAWLFFTLLSNYLDRGYHLHGYATSLEVQDEKAIIARWDPFILTNC